MRVTEYDQTKPEISRVERRVTRKDIGWDTLKDGLKRYGE